MDDAKLSDDEVKSKLRRYVSHELLLDDRELTDDAPLLEGVVDSVGLMELVSFIEEDFGVAIDFKDVTPENFKSVNDIARLVHGLLSGA